MKMSSNNSPSKTLGNNSPVKSKPDATNSPSKAQFLNQTRIEGEGLIKNAEEAIQGSFFKNLFTFKTKRLENGLDLYYKAGNLYKDIKSWKEAGYCFRRCGEIEEELNAESASHFQYASYCYSFIDPDLSNKMCDKAIEIYEKQGKFDLAGNLIKKRAEVNEEQEDYLAALECYKRSTQLYSQDKIKSYFNFLSSRLKEADNLIFLSNKTNFNEATKIYEETIPVYLANQLLKSSVKEIFFKLICLHLAFSNADVIEKSLLMFSGVDTRFSSSPEFIFLTNAFEVITKNDLIGFKKYVTEYDKYNTVEKWRRHLVAKICENKFKE